MNFNEACSILEIPPTATPEEAKKKYKTLSKKFHPDVNKADDATEKFKKINEAYQVISKGPVKDEVDWQGGFNPFINNPFMQNRVHQTDNVNLYTTLSFKDSIFGCKVDLKFKRKIKCNICNGKGAATLNNGCDKCNGLGQITTKQGNMMFIRTCDKCHGKSTIEECKNCNASGLIDAESTINVSIPGGVQNNNVLRLGGMGNFVSSFGPMEQYTDAHLHLNVTPESDLTLQGNDVVSNINISLLEAIRGCSKTVKTVIGDKEIEIKPLSKNKEEVIIPNLGVNQVGNQRVILQVNYPINIDKLVDILDKGNE